MAKKLTALILAVVFGLISHQSFAAARQKDGIPVEPQYEHIASVNATLDIRGGTALCSGSGRGRYVETTTVLLVTLQKRVSGSKIWTPVCSWSGTADGKAAVRINEEKNVSTGYDYRVYAKCTVKDAEGVVLETGWAYSQIVSY